MKEHDILDFEVLEVIRQKYDEIFAAEKKVADFVLQNPKKTVDSNVSELAKQSGVSDATIIRMCHHIGYSGYYQFRITLARDLGKKQHVGLEIPKNAGAVERLFQQYAKNALSVGKAIEPDIMWNSVNLIKTCKEVHLIAVGNTCVLTQYMGFRLGRLGIKSSYGRGAEYFMNHVNLADPEDIVLAISKSGTSKQVLAGMELAKDKGLKTIAITAHSQSPIAEIADYVLLASGSDEDWSYYEDYAQADLMLMIDALLKFVTNDDMIKKTQADKPEMILSEYKL